MLNAHSPTSPETVFSLWCRLTGTEPTEFSTEEKHAFLARPQVPELAALPFEVLLDAGISAAKHATLPLEHWLSAAQALRPAVT
ncbi:MAG TPA: hypothetical protein VGH01_08045 [Jatrophihabitantaceae bacterium]|jgi:hypothetical protein